MAKPTRYTAEIIRGFYEKGDWLPVTLAEVWRRNAERYPDREAVVDGKSRLTWGQAVLLVDRLATALLGMGLKKDDVLVIQLPNCVELVLLRLACERAGGLCLPVLRNLRARDIENILGRVEARAIAIPWRYRDFDFWAMVAEMRPRLKNLDKIIVVGDSAPPGAISFKNLMDEDAGEKRPDEVSRLRQGLPDGFTFPTPQAEDLRLRSTAQAEDLRLRPTAQAEDLRLRPTPPTHDSGLLDRTGYRPEEVCLISHTTGTTGFPKFVEYPMAARLKLGSGFVEAFRLTEKDVVCALGSIPAGVNNCAYFAAPLAAAKVVMLEHFEPEAAFSVIEKERVTVACGVPAMWALMVKHPRRKDYDLSSMRLWWSGSAFLPYPLALEVEKELGATIVNGYGAADFGGTTIASPEDPRDIRILTVGQPRAGTLIKIGDDSGVAVAPGEIGEIWGSGPACASGYYRDPEATRQAWTGDGWFRTGDLGKVDDRGNLILAGRKKEIIIRGGQNIYPAEIENLLLAHPAVEAVAVVAIPDAVMGEKACACVVLKPGQGLTLEDVAAFLKQLGVAPYKIPERLELLEKLPLVGDQKVDKKALLQDIVDKLVAASNLGAQNTER